MKFFLAIFTIALVAQVSFGASIQRSKRDAEEKKDAYAVLKEFFPQVRAKFEVVFKEIPDTAAYAKYRKSFEDLFKLYDEKNDEDLCFEKYGKIIEKITVMFDYGETDKSEEAAKIKEIFAKYKDEEFRKKYDSAFENAKEPNFFDLLETC